ncbi:MAG: prepilin peptidase [Candidatus Iainarchaeum sp.]|jgi:preflagellin peptidase FlaK
MEPITISFFHLSIIISLIGLIIATYTDLKERIVPNKLNYGLAIIGLSLYLIQSIIETNPLPFLYSLLGMILGFGFGWVMWKLGVFAGGDVKLFMGLGALNPFTPSLTGAITNTTIPLFPITLFIYSLFAFLPYGIFVVIVKLYKNKKMQKEIFEEMKPKIILSIHTAIFASAAYAVLYTYSINSLIIIPLILIWGTLKENKKYATIITSIIAIILSHNLFIQALLAAILISVILYSLFKTLLSVKRVLITEVEVKKLTEGMIPAKTLIWKGKKVVEQETLNLKLILKAIKNKNSNILKEMLAPKEEIISANKARGINDEELELVKELAKKGLIPKKMLIKESMPFVPTMLLGYIICLIIGDAIFILIGVI